MNYGHNYSLPLIQSLPTVRYLGPLNWCHNSTFCFKKKSYSSTDGMPNKQNPQMVLSFSQKGLILINNFKSLGWFFWNCTFYFSSFMKITIEIWIWCYSHPQPMFSNESGNLKFMFNFVYLDIHSAANICHNFVCLTWLFRDKIYVIFQFVLLASRIFSKFVHVCKLPEIKDKT